MIAIALFELRQRLKMLSTWVYFTMFFLISVLWVVAAGGVFPGVIISFGSKILINSPYAVSQCLTTLGYLGIVIVAAMMGRSVQQDFECGIQHFFFSAPISKRQYLLGRFTGAFLALVLVFSSIGLGAWLGTLMPGIEADRLGPSTFLAYFLPYLFNLLPNMFLFGAMFFMLAGLTRRMLPVYVASVVLLIGYLIAGALSRDIDNKDLASLLDPFGSRAMARVTEYWSVAEKNRRLVPFEGVYLLNRVIWLCAGLAAFAAGYWRFRFAAALDLKAGKGAAATAAAPGSGSNAAIRLAVAYAPDFAKRGRSGLLLKMTWLNLRETVKNIYFVVIALSGVMFMIAATLNVGKMFGTATYPVTYQTLETVSGGFFLFMLIITIFYSGELVWREREARIALMIDAMPTPTWLPLLAKLFALIGVQILLLLVVMLCGMAIQLAQGYSHLEPELYLQGLFLIQLPKYALLAVLAIAVQVLINEKYLAYFVMILYYVASIALALLGFDHPMVLYGIVPDFVYSDMNGYGHYLAREYWFDLYWGGAALVLTVLSLLFWQRGANSGWAMRLRLARRALTHPALAGLAFGALVFGAAGGVLFYNLNVLNRYQTPFQKQGELADYEKRYKKYSEMPQPRITDVKLAVDITPETRSVAIKGHYQLENRSAAPIGEIFVQLSGNPSIRALRWSLAASGGIVDKDIGFYSYKLRQALPPGGKIDLDFDFAFVPEGILGLGPDRLAIGNGTFFNSLVMPHIGYQASAELDQDRDRKKHGLGPKERLALRDDAKGLANSIAVNDADWITFDATVSTSPDQIALAPGYLEKEWLANGRRYFHYTMDKPILNFYAFLSARYAVKHDRWNDIPIDIYYHPGHEYNLDRMFKGVKAGLDYDTRNFGPYQHKQVRIIEFPRYARFAQAFPNTIPYSESIGFIAKVNDNDPKDIDYPFYVTAHEVAHQWWGHQVVAGNTRGATALSETLAQYSALMVMKHAYGEAKMRRFLSFELDRYLSERAVESKKELPLGHNEGQGYIHYRKGSLAMYQLQDVLGEDKVNAVLRDIVTRHGGKGAPYPNASVLVDGLRNAAPPEMKYLVDDLFESIVLYENHAVSASARRRADGQYEVKVKIAAAKVKAGELGEEKDAPLKDWIDIGVDDADGKPLARERKLIDQKEMDFVLTVKGVPAKAGIDPDNKLIDRKPKDNLIKVEVEKD